MPARRQNGPRSGTHLGTSAATARSAKAEIAESEYCSRFPRGVSGGYRGCIRRRHPVGIYILSVFLSFCLSVFLSFCLSVFLSFCLSVFLSFCLSVFPPSLFLFFSLSFFSLFLSFPLPNAKQLAILPQHRRMHVQAQTVPPRLDCPRLLCCTRTRRPGMTTTAGLRANQYGPWSSRSAVTRSRFVGSSDCPRPDDSTAPCLFSRCEQP